MSFGGASPENVAKGVSGPARDALAEPTEQFGAFAAELEDDFAKASRASLGATAWRAISSL